MPSLPVIPDLYEIEYGLPSLLNCSKAYSRTFCSQRSEETLHHGIVIAVAGSTHAGLDTIVLQDLAVFLAGILAAAITVMDQVAVNTPLSQSHFQGSLRQLAVRLPLHSPAHNPARICV